MEDGYIDTDNFGKLSRINSAGIVNSTLNNLWIDFYRHFRDGRYLSANSDLDCIWTILGGEKNMEGSDEEVSYKKIEKELYESGMLGDKLEITGFDRVEDKQIARLSAQKKVLLKKALFLRRLQNKQGKGTAYNDGEDEEFE